MRSTLLKALAIAALATTALAVAPASGTGPVNVLTYGYGVARTGHDTVDPHVGHVSASAAWHAKLDGAVYGVPLAFNGAVIVGTENNTIYALRPTTGAKIWSLHLGAPARTSVIDQATGLGSYCGDINPLGITGTPVISPNGTIYVAYEGYNGTAIWQNIRHYLAAVSASTHKLLWKRVIDPPGGNKAGGYTIAAEQQRPALALLGSRVYVNFGGLAGDCGTYHGYVLGLPTSGVGTELYYKVPTVTEGAIWDLGGAMVASNGNLFVTTGNGGTSTFDGSDAVIELTPTLHLVDQWAPTNWSTLSAYDWDLGSGGAIQVPGTAYVFAAGKATSDPAAGFVNKIGSLGHGPGAPLFAAATCAPGDGGVFGAEASAVVTIAGHARAVLYVPCRNGTEAIEFPSTSTPSFVQLWAPSTGSPNGSPIVAGGLVWALDYYGSQLYGMNMGTGHVVFQRSTDGLNHFATPTLELGHLVIPTRSGVEAFTVAT
jgi:outer membrane protein assembly factor BamB